jgi:hypothetical protein
MRQCASRPPLGQIGKVFESIYERGIWKRWNGGFLGTYEMGRAKAWMMEQEERGYTEAVGDICADCVNDAFLKQWISDNAEATECSFCGADSDKEIAASFDDFVGVVLGGIHFDWGSPDGEGIVYETREGGWQAKLTDTTDIVSNMGISEEEDVIESIIQSIDNWSWVSRDFYRGSDSDILTWGWNSFQSYVKNESRYFFLSRTRDKYDFEQLSPGDLLKAISDIIKSDDIPKSPIQMIAPSATIIRIRIDDREHHLAADIGAPPGPNARWSNRMSPAGIPMFYGAFDYETAHAETFDPANDQGRTISAGSFVPLRPLRVLDLANLADIPSVFDEGGRDLIHSLRFLHDFARDISKPIARDGREHIEYVPTQIVTEYFRRIFRLAGGLALDGIMYRSSKRPGNNAIVLFCENGQSIDIDDDPKPQHLLRMLEVSHYVAASTLAQTKRDSATI